MLTEFQRDSDATENLKSCTAFTYDALNRLTGSTRRLEVYPYDTLAYSYTYDTLGNLLKQSGPTKGEEDTYQYNDLNQMVSKPRDATEILFRQNGITGIKLVYSTGN